MSETELEVRLYNKRAGTLARDEKNRLTFEYDEAYGRNEPPLSTCMPIRSGEWGPRQAEPWFDGLLAEGSRREQLARIAGAASLDTWSLLRVAGGDCAGAVQIIGPEHADNPGLFHLDHHRLATLLRERPIEPVGTISRAARISLAGAQEKVALYRNRDGSWAVPTGGHPSTHILKPHSTKFPGLVENEHWCMEVARRAGLPTANTWIEKIGGAKVLVVERYDREKLPDGTFERIHQEDMAQALASHTKYQSEGFPSTYDLFAIPGPDRNALFNHLMFSWLIGNCDTHAKNYSILEPGTCNARLAPIYDMLSTESYERLDRKLATRIGRMEHLNAVNEHAVEAMGRRIGFEPGEATKRLHDLAERTRRAALECESEGIGRGPVLIDTILDRLDKACKWAKA